MNPQEVTRRQLISATGAAGVSLLLAQAVYAGDGKADPEYELSPNTGKVKPGDYAGSPDKSLEVVEHSLELPKDLKPGVYHDGKLIIAKQGALTYGWGVIGILRKSQVGAFTFTNVSGTRAVGGCFNEWDGHNNRPHFGDARMLLLEVARRLDQVRVAGIQHYGTIHCAMGFVVG